MNEEYCWICKSRIYDGQFVTEHLTMFPKLFSLAHVICAQELAAKHKEEMVDSLTGLA